MSQHSSIHLGPLYDYMCKVSLRESPLLAALRQETNSLPEATMQIAPEQGQLMALLVRLSKAQRALEVGTFTGYSALCIAQALPAEGRLLCCDINSDWTQIAQRYWTQAGVAHKIDLRLQPALDTMKSLLANAQHEPFDFIFIDADKAHYGRYYELGLQLLRDGGLMLFDNVFWHGKVLDKQHQDKDTLAIRALNQTLKQDPRVQISLLPVADGLFLVHKHPDPTLLSPPTGTSTHQ